MIEEGESGVGLDEGGWHAMSTEWCGVEGWWAGGCEPGGSRTEGTDGCGAAIGDSGDVSTTQPRPRTIITTI
jgi:hypothetical protein